MTIVSDDLDFVLVPEVFAVVDCFFLPVVVHPDDFALAVVVLTLRRDDEFDLAIVFVRVSFLFPPFPPSFLLLEKQM